MLRLRLKFLLFNENFQFIGMNYPPNLTSKTFKCIISHINSILLNNSISLLKNNE